MKQLIFILTLLTSLTSFGQEIKEMKPELGSIVDKSPEGEIEFIIEREKCEEIWRKVSNKADYESLSATDKEIYENCSEEYENYWDILGVGCSWYCGGGQDTLSASSELKTFKGITYSSKNVHDLSYKTAWIEGVPGYGIGEAVTYHFPPQNPRITEIIVVNGYVKSEKAWKENSRVKKLKMYIDNKPLAILNLYDTRKEQHFKFEPLGYSDREDWDKLKSKSWWTIKFEILEVYGGDKYDDTAITEIYFDGIDVH
jgi:hypothetical protein